MASMGLKYCGWAKISAESASAAPTYSSGANIGKMIAADVKFNTAEGELYADDALAEWAKEITSADVSVELDDLTLKDRGDIFGSAYTAASTSPTATPETLKINTGDTQPYGGLGFYQVLMVGGVKKYRAYIFAKCRASIPDEAMATKGSSISFAGTKVTFRALAPKFGDMIKITDHDTEADALSAITTALSIS